jgi:hypothetical protein
MPDPDPAFYARRARARKFQAKVSDAIGHLFTEGLPGHDFADPGDRKGLADYLRELAAEVERFDPHFEGEWYLP